MRLGGGFPEIYRLQLDGSVLRRRIEPALDGSARSDGVTQQLDESVLCEQTAATSQRCVEGATDWIQPVYEPRELTAGWISAVRAGSSWTDQCCVEGSNRRLMDQRGQME